MTKKEIIEIAKTANEMARRIGGRLALSQRKLMALGLTKKQVDEVQRRANIDEVYIN